LISGLVGATADVHCYDLLSKSGAGNVVLISYLHFRLSIPFVSCFAMYTDQTDFSSYFDVCLSNYLFILYKTNITR
jgi:hypothetical protein